MSTFSILESAIYLAATSRLAMGNVLRFVPEESRLGGETMAQNISALRDVVQQTIDEGRLGEPKFLRCIALASGGDDLESALGKLVSLGEAWFGAPATLRYRLGESSGLYLTEMLKWAGGQSATVTASAAPSKGASSLDLMLVGSKGTLYHEI